MRRFVFDAATKVPCALAPLQPLRKRERKKEATTGAWAAEKRGRGFEVPDGAYEMNDPRKRRVEKNQRQCAVDVRKESESI